MTINPNLNPNPDEIPGLPHTIGQGDEAPPPSPVSAPYENKDILETATYVATQTPTLPPYPYLLEPTSTLDPQKIASQVIRSLGDNATGSARPMAASLAEVAAPPPKDLKTNLETQSFVGSKQKSLPNPLLGVVDPSAAIGSASIVHQTDDVQKGLSNAMSAFLSITDKIHKETQTLAEASDKFAINLTQASLNQLSLWIDCADKLTEYSSKITEVDQEIAANEADTKLKQSDIAAKNKDLQNLKNLYLQIIPYAVHYQGGPGWTNYLYYGTSHTKAIPGGLSTFTKFRDWVTQQVNAGATLSSFSHIYWSALPYIPVLNPTPIIQEITKFNGQSYSLSQMITDYGTYSSDISGDNDDIADNTLLDTQQLPAQIAAWQTKFNSVAQVLKNSLGLPPNYSNDLLQQIVKTLEDCKKQISQILVALEMAGQGNALAIFITVKNLISVSSVQYQQKIGEQNFQDSQQNLVQLDAMSAMSELISSSLQDMEELQAHINSENSAIQGMQYTIYGLTAGALVAHIGGLALAADPATLPIAGILELVGGILDIVAGVLGVAMAGVQIAVGAQEIQVSQDQKTIADEKYNLSKAQVYSTELQQTLSTITANLMSFVKKLQEEMKETSDMQSSSQATISSLKG